MSVLTTFLVNINTIKRSCHYVYHKLFNINNNSNNHNNISFTRVEYEVLKYLFKRGL